jgi:hypothetical protein
MIFLIQFFINLVKNWKPVMVTDLLLFLSLSEISEKLCKDLGKLVHRETELFKLIFLLQKVLINIPADLRYHCEKYLCWQNWMLNL